MSKQDDNKAIVGRWFTDYWVVEELGLDDGVTALTQLGLLRAA